MPPSFLTKKKAPWKQEPSHSIGAHYTWKRDRWDGVSGRTTPEAVGEQDSQGKVLISVPLSSF